MKCIIDTNSLIHYKMFSEIDWLSELSSSNVGLIICPTVLQELDRKKFAESNIDIRNRSQKIISKLSEFMDNTIIRNNITIKFLEKEPQIDWEKENLSKDIPDDRIIATALELADMDNLIIVSADLGLKLKSKSRNIKTHTLSDDLLVKVKKVKQEAELIKLRQRVAHLENRLPKLSLKIIDNKSYSEFKKYMYNEIKDYDSAEANKIVTQLRSKLEYTLPEVESNSLSLAFSQFGLPSEEEITRYRNDVEKYLSDLLKYYEDEWHHKVILSRIFQIDLLLLNDGNTPAEDVEIFLHFPDGFKMFQENEIPHQPKKPEEPDKPRTMSEIIMGHTGLTVPSSLLNPSYFPQHSDISTKGTDTSPNIKETNSYDVFFRIDKLKHKINIQLDPLLIYFENYDSINSFSFNYTILADNYPDEFQGELNIIFS